MDMEEGGDEIDPLDAFMADNETKVASVKTEPASTDVKEEEDEVDPLDAFMMGNDAAAGARQPPEVKLDPDSKPSTSGQRTCKLDSLQLMYNLQLSAASELCAAPLHLLHEWWEVKY